MIDRYTDFAELSRHERAGNDDYIQLMRREEQMRDIRDDAVVRYTECSRSDQGHVFLVMDYIDGPSIADEMLLPWVNIFLSAPLTALVPVLMVLFGFGTKTVIITTTLFAVWIIILNARAGVKQINRSLVEMARSFGASPFDAFFKVYFWAALPEILGGVRIVPLGCLRCHAQPIVLVAVAQAEPARIPRKTRRNVVEWRACRVPAPILVASALNCRALTDR